MASHNLSKACLEKDRQRWINWLSRTVRFVSFAWLLMILCTRLWRVIWHHASRAFKRSELTLWEWEQRGSEHRLALGIEKWSISRRIGEQGRHNTGIAALHCEPASPKGTQEGQEHLPSSGPQAAASPPERPTGARDVEKHRNCLHRGGAHGRNDFREPRLLHPPTHARALNSSTWDIWF